MEATGGRKQDQAEGEMECDAGLTKPQITTVKTPEHMPIRVVLLPEDKNGWALLSSPQPITGCRLPWEGRDLG